MIRVLIAEDSPIFALLLQDLVAGQPDMTCVGCVDDGLEAVQACLELQPDLVLMDIHMPHLDGLSATARIMAQSPTPILIVTSDPFRGGINLSFRALELGALDLVSKDELRPESQARLVQKIRLLAGIPVVRHVLGERRPHTPTKRSMTKKSASTKVPLIAVAASTGGPRALAKILGELPAQLGAAVVVVQHITQGFSSHLANWLDQHCALSVRLATPGQELRRNQVLIAPDEMHMEVQSQGRIRLNERPPVQGHRPSADVLFSSVSHYNPSQTIGLVLSGMGQDGARGLSLMREAGAQAWVQDRDSAVIYGMPQAALLRVTDAHVVELAQIAPRMLEQVAKWGNGR